MLSSKACESVRFLREGEVKTWKRSVRHLSASGINVCLAGRSTMYLLFKQARKNSQDRIFERVMCSRPHASRSATLLKVNVQGEKHTDLPITMQSVSQNG